MKEKEKVDIESLKEIEKCAIKIEDDGSVSVECPDGDIVGKATLAIAKGVLVRQAPKVIFLEKPAEKKAEK